MSVKTRKNSKTKRIIWLILSLLWMGVIFFLSSRTAGQSAAMSDPLTLWIQETFFPEYSHVTSAEYWEFIGMLSFFIRKLAHLAVFGFLAFLVTGFFSTFRLSNLFVWLIAFLFTVLYAISDEFHQAFVDGRSMATFDVFVDSLGALIGSWLSLGTICLIRFRNFGK